MMTEKIYDAIKECRLFNNIPEESCSAALKYLNARVRSFRKGEIIMHIGDKFRYAGLVLDGIIECSYQDSEYNKFNMNHFSAGELFGESIACAEIEASPMQVFAVTDCVIMFLDFKMLHESAKACEFQLKLSGNLMRMLSAKNIFLNQKVRILSCKDLRGRITGYLYTLTQDKKGTATLPFSKTALAEFLCVNRTALSRELRRMIQEGLIAMNGRKITFLCKQ